MNPTMTQTGSQTPSGDAARLTAVLQSEAGIQEKSDACRELAVCGTKDAVPALAALLSHEELSHMARYALEPLPDPSVDDALRASLDRLTGRPLVGVIGSLGVRRDRKAVPLLVKMLQHSDADVVGAAARSLGRIGGAEAAEALQQALATAPPGARPAVADGCLMGAEKLLESGQRSQAAVLYQAVAKADLPQHFRVAAKQGSILAQQPKGG